MNWHDVISATKREGETLADLAGRPFSIVHNIQAFPVLHVQRNGDAIELWTRKPYTAQQIEAAARDLESLVDGTARHDTPEIRNGAMSEAAKMLHYLRREVLRR